MRTAARRLTARLVTTALVCAGAACVGSTVPAQAAPQPDPVPRRWQLDVKPGPLRLALIQPEGLPAPRAYLYFTYYVENNTGEDLLFAPSFEMTTDLGDRRKSGAGVPRDVTQTLLARLRNPFLKDQISAVGLLLQGDEHAREGLVVWPIDNLEVDEVTVFCAGFSGETKTVLRPDTGEPVLLRKTLMLRHQTPGDLAALGSRPLTRAEQRWIMR
ncbi:MAG: hypothetical protein D6693_03890 [Planctomycetota bacterium]|nr:MAG: hypothetical protein D6693_03890 [Planctomycetota bacterium]